MDKAHFCAFYPFISHTKADTMRHQVEADARKGLTNGGAREKQDEGVEDGNQRLDKCNDDLAHYLDLSEEPAQETSPTVGDARQAEFRLQF